MKLILDFFPIVLFFAVYKFTNDLIVATLVLIPATLVQVVISYLMTKKVEPMPSLRWHWWSFWGGHGLPERSCLH